jgi:choline dehydrogenase-like flavoprotein
MIRVLAGAPAAFTRLEADVLVVGGGIAGLLLATRLASTGKRVVVLESGGMWQEGETHPLNEVVHLRSVYDGAANGRFRCLGGTSTRWGGAMIPFLPADLANGQWPIAHADLVAYLPEVERLFALPPGRYDFPDLTRRDDNSPPSHLARLAKWPAFQRRNVAVLLNAELHAEDGPEVWIHATATRFAFAPNGRLESVEAEAPDGRRLLVHATETVIAAGAIESTRLLLLANRQHDNQLFAPDGVLGRYFYDHLLVAVGRIVPADRKALNRVAGFRFEGRGMRNLRFEPTEDPAIRAQVPPGFAHIAFTSPEGSGLDALRALYRRLQQRRLPDASTLARLAKAAPWLARATWWRFAERRLLYPSDAAIELHMVIEQRPVAENRILLSSERIDVFGQPLAAIDWGVSREDEAALTRSTDFFCNLWLASPLVRLGEIDRRSPIEAASELSKGGVYHPGGSARMGRGPTDGVVDSDFRVFRIPNLSLVSTAAFPTGGGANPTMMLMMAALRTADRLAGRAVLSVRCSGGSSATCG